MGKTNSVCKLLILGLFGTVLFGLPVNIFSQSPKIGILDFVRENDRSDRFVIINNKQSVNGQVIVSPSNIEVPVETELLVDLGCSTLLRMGSDTKINLAFNETKITGLLSRGSLTVKVPPNSGFVIETLDGAVSAPNQNQENIATINFVGGRTQVKTVSGMALFGSTLIAPGESFIAGDSSVRNIILTPRLSIYAYLIIPGATILFDLFTSSEPTDRSNFGVEQTNVGPIK